MAAGKKRAVRRGRGENPAATLAGLNWWMWLLVALAAFIGLWTLLAPERGQRGETRQAVSTPADQGIALATKFDRIYQNVEGANEFDADSQLTELATPQFQEALSNKITALYDGVEASPLGEAEPGVQLLARSVPIAYKVESTGAGKMTVSIWSMTLAGVAGDVTPRASWVRNRITLEDQAGEWLVSAIEPQRAPVPARLTEDVPTREKTFWKQLEGVKFYENAQ